MSIFQWKNIGLIKQDHQATCLLTSAIVGLIFCAPAYSETQCPIPSDDKTASINVSNPLKPSIGEVIVTSDKADITRSQYAEFSGNVTIYQQQQTVKADKALFNQQLKQFNAQGNVQLSSSSASVVGESIRIDEQKQNFELQNASYQFGFNAGRGKAESFAIKNNNKLSLKGATFTTCPGDDPSWLFSAQDIYINPQKGWGEAWNTTFNVGGVPIMWVPYATFPITDERKSGLLFPKFGSSSSFGVYFAQPLYLNLAPNYDVTFTPQYMSERGWLWKSNFRHLSDNSYNELQLEFINDDKSSDVLEERYLAYWQHNSNWSDNLKVTSQLTQLGDDNYLSEFGSHYHHKSDTYLNNFISVSYFSDNYDLTFTSQDIYELGPQVSSYKVPVQITLNLQNNTPSSSFKTTLNSQYSLFTHDELDINEVTRLHLEPGFKFDYNTPAYQFLVSSSYLATFYKQSNQTTLQDENVDRQLFKHRILTGLNFERETKYFSANVRQTFEPKIQYLYVEDTDQSDIGLYDSQLLKEDYFSLFRDNIYSGLDRISAMNQATLGFSSSIFNKKNQELFRIGVAKIFKFESFEGTNQEVDDSNSAFAVEWFGQLSTNWQMDGALLYNSETDTLESGFLSFDYWLAKDKNIQINHRYADDLAGVKINQTGLFSSYQLSQEWSIAASYHYNLETDVTLDALLGIEYRSCCWSIQLAAQRQVVVDLNQVQFNDENAIEYDNGISINFKISGMGGDISSSIADLFSDSIFTYRRPYLITN